jgi:hypothetical protein
VASTETTVGDVAVATAEAGGERALQRVYWLSTKKLGCEKDDQASVAIIALFDWNSCGFHDRRMMISLLGPA